MKKKLEADLISIAHRILKLKNKSDIIQLHQETQKLYEKLSVLRFVEEHFGETKPTIGQSEIEEKLETAFDSEATDVIDSLSEETTPVSTENSDSVAPQVEEMKLEEEVSDEILDEEPIEEDAIEEETILDEEIIEEKPIEEDFKSVFELSFETNEAVNTAPKQISFEELLGQNYTELEFVKADSISPISEAYGTDENVQDESFETEVPEGEVDIPVEETVEITETSEDEPSVNFDKENETIDALVDLHRKEAETKATTNEKFTTGISFGLNDRIGFEKHLFAGSSEDMNRVVSQLGTFDSFEEVQNFIEDMVKPDYDNWEGKEDYVQRFMDIVEKKFA